jgi:hypothetical protein
MGLIVMLTAATALAVLGFILSRPEAEKDWRGQAEGLRQRLERDDALRAPHTKMNAMPIMLTTD